MVNTFFELYNPQEMARFTVITRAIWSDKIWKVSKSHTNILFYPHSSCAKVVVSRLSRQKSLVSTLCGPHNTENLGSFLPGQWSFFGFKAPLHSFYRNEWSLVSSTVSRFNIKSLGSTNASHSIRKLQ